MINFDCVLSSHLPYLSIIIYDVQETCSNCFVILIMCSVSVNIKKVFYNGGNNMTNVISWGLIVLVMHCAVRNIEKHHWVKVEQFHIVPYNWDFTKNLHKSNINLITTEQRHFPFSKSVTFQTDKIPLY